MITAVFYKKGSDFSGFRVSGHAGYDDHGFDIVCASVSSAVELTADLITDSFKFKAETEVADNVVTLKIAEISEENQKTASKIIEGLKVLLDFLGKSFERTIKTKISEV
ncbi:MAG: ribosomal-processing cysteine protease Prp [Oscillospiraceae bacterium]|nr:ribosomal-processing cysteine protease Prp [Oscillospiraceae bacterium]